VVLIHPPAVLGRGNGETDGQVGVAHAGRAERDHILPPLDGRERVEALELVKLD
jgi:hypothetical protein